MNSDELKNQTQVPILVLCFELHTYYSFKETLITVCLNKLRFS